MSTLKTHNLQSPDAGSVNIALTSNAGMIVTGISTFSGQINVGSNIKLGTAGVVTATSFVGSGAALTGIDTDLVSDTSPQLGGGLASNGFNINFADSNGSNNAAKFGASGDLMIYHDTAHSRLVDTGTGDLKLQSSKVTIGNAGNTETMATFTENGAVELYHNNHKSFNTNANGITLTAPEGGDCVIDMNADEGDDNPDKWRINISQGGSFQLKNYADGSWENHIQSTVNSAVELYHNGTKRLETTSSGVEIPHALFVGEKIDMPDHTSGTNGMILLGTGDDLYMYHDGTNSHLRNNTGTFNVRAGNFRLTDAAIQHVYLNANSNGNDEIALYYDNGRKLLTSSHGIIVEDENPYIVIKDSDTSSGNGVVGWIEAQNSSGNAMWKIGNTHNDQNTLWINQTQNASTKFTGAVSGDTWEIFGNSGHFTPCTNNTFDIGTTSRRVRNIYTNDLHLSNEGHSNEVDNTWGDFTIQEGESDLFLINNRSGKKYKFNLTEVS